MIEYTSPAHPGFSQVQGHPLAVVNIGGRASCPQPGQDFWLAWENRCPVGFFCRSGTTIYATAPDSMAEQVAELAAGVGFRELITSLVLPFPARELLVMEQTGELPEKPAAPDIAVAPGGGSGFSAVEFALLQYAAGALDSKDETQRYAVDLSHRLRHGSGTVVTLRREGRLAAGAALGYSYGGRALVEAVAVLPEYRKQGLGREIVAAVCALAQERGWQALLCCHTALEPLYRNAGFTRVEAPIYCYGMAGTTYLPERKLK